VSYCRFGYGSDVYVYESCFGGILVHVAASRHSNPKPYPEMPPGWWLLPPDEALAIHKEQIAWYQESTLEPIGLSADGGEYSFDSPGDAADCLERLRGMGYRVPEHAIRVLRDEAKEEPPCQTT